MFGSQTHAIAEARPRIHASGCEFQLPFWGEGITPYVDGPKARTFGMSMERNTLITAWHFGPIILGHSYDEVDQKVIEEIQKGILFAMTGELEVAVAEMIVEMAPAVEMVRLACSGTEATMHAIRVARAFTGRDIILKFEGNYHGFHDHTLWSTYAPWKHMATGAVPSRCRPHPEFPSPCASSSLRFHSMTSKASNV
jgi:glutamate-1-semialdehyde 2,1-aminomutase